MFNKFILAFVVIFVFLISFLAAVGTPNMIHEMLKNIVMFITLVMVVGVVLVTVSTVIFVSKDKSNNDFLY